MKYKRIQIGDRFGRLTVIGKDFSNGAKRGIWVCQCDCGGEKRTNNLRWSSQGAKSCGCLYKETHGRDLEDISGQIFGRTKVLSKIKTNNQGKWLWECQCSCGKKHLALASSLKRHLVQSCGCQKAEKARQNGGRKHWNWQGGKTPKSHADRHACYVWRGQIFRRDNYTCQCCSQKGRLNAHHLESFHAKPELREDLENGITLCVNCHKDFHKRYGKLNNTKAQFEEYRNEKILRQNLG